MIPSSLVVFLSFPFTVISAAAVIPGTKYGRVIVYAVNLSRSQVYYHDPEFLDDSSFTATSKGTVPGSSGYAGVNIRTPLIWIIIVALAPLIVLAVLLLFRQRRPAQNDPITIQDLDPYTFSRVKGEVDPKIIPLKLIGRGNHDDNEDNGDLHHKTSLQTMLHGGCELPVFTQFHVSTFPGAPPRGLFKETM